MKAISVTELNNQIKGILEPHFEVVLVEGEVSKVVYHNSGHLYFTLKDENSAINCAMWRSSLSKLKFRLKEGEKVYVYGAISLYIPRGEYKIIATNIEPSGIGALQKAFKQLKEELSKLGYFDERRKKPIPKFPKRVAIITSATSAALQDMLRIAKKRWLLTEFYLFDTLVQGEGASKDIAMKTKMADEFIFEDGRGFDLIILGRGGGSKEDLWALNERVVADAIFFANTPVISAVGHEIDYLISDFVADKRAATPSNAMEIALPDRNEILLMIDEMINNFNYKIYTVLEKKQKELMYLKEVFKASSPINKLNLKLNQIEVLEKRFKNSFIAKIQQCEKNLNNLKHLFNLKSPINRIDTLLKETKLLKDSFKIKTYQIISSKEKEINNLKEAYLAFNPKNREKVGFSEISKDGRKVSLEEIKKGDVFYLSNTRALLKAKALEKISK